MRAVIITQDDPFFVPDALARLLSLIEGRHEVAGCVLLAASPFGRKESMAAKALKTLRIFGPRFFLRYASRFVWSRLARPNRVARLFEARGIPVLRLEGSINAEASLARIRALAPDVLVSVVGNEIFRRPLLDLAPRGCLNLHTALLPRYRGLMPTFWVLRHGEAETGVSVFLVDEGIDTGPIVRQERVAIGGRTQEELILETKAIGMRLIAEALDALEAGDPELIENPDAGSSYFGFPTAADVAAFRAAGARFF